MFGLFSHLIPQDGLSRIERGRKRQGLGSAWLGLVKRGEEKLVLAELKVLSCPTRYSPTLVQSLATSRAKTVALQRGRECVEGELAGK